MPRYEFSEGGSNKFWDIALAGTSLTIKFGKIGAAGQTQIKKLASDAEAKKTYDKLIAEKTKKGYALVGGKGKATVAAKTAKAAKAPKPEKPAKGKAKADATPAGISHDPRAWL